MTMDRNSLGATLQSLVHAYLFNIKRVTEIPGITVQDDALPGSYIAYHVVVSFSEEREPRQVEELAFLAMGCWTSDDYETFVLASLLCLRDRENAPYEKSAVPYATAPAEQVLVEEYINRTCSFSDPEAANKQL